VTGGVDHLIPGQHHPDFMTKSGQRLRERADDIGQAPTFARGPSRLQSSRSSELHLLRNRAASSGEVGLM